MFSYRRGRVTAVAAATLTLAVPAAASAAPSRVVALTPFGANTAVQLGVPPVAIGAVLGGQDRLDPRLSGVPRLTLSHPNGPNSEELAALTPDLVLSAPIWTGGTAAMQAAAPGATVQQTEPTSVDDVVTKTQTIGGLLEKPAEAAAAAAALKGQIAQATRGVKRHPRVFLVLGTGTSTLAFLPNSWGGSVVRKAGGTLLTAGLRDQDGQGFAKLSDEAVIAGKPDVIIAVPHGNPDDLAGIQQKLANRPGWRTTPAAKKKRVYVATGNSLLQPLTDVGRTITDVRKKFLKN